MTERPAKLYKYLSLSGEDRWAWAEATVKQGALFFACPLKFNDPYEARFTASAAGSPDEWRQYWKRVADPALIGWAGGGQLTVTKLAEQVIERLKTFPERFREDLQREVSMCCLSERPDVPSMWAHYADNNRGICVELDATQPGTMFAEAERVQYASEFPTFNLLTTSADERARLVFLTKADCWAYEREWRIVHAGGPEGIQKFDARLISGVVLGCHIDARVAEEVVGWCRGRIPVSRAVVRDGAYALDVVPVQSWASIYLTDQAKACNL